MVETKKRLGKKKFNEKPSEVSVRVPGPCSIDQLAVSVHFGGTVDVFNGFFAFLQYLLLL